ncbi:MAG TPA: VOC family protein [Thermoplasmata archaeon]|nr:VOC family protein [Thermoplasmata archaeon]
MRFDTPGLRVRDLPRSLRFYTRALGLREVKRGDTRSWGGGIWVLLRDPRSGRRLELNWYPRGSRFYEPYATGTALDHLDFTMGVAAQAELERAYRRLLRFGGRPTGYEPSTTEGWMASVQDPDGIWITIGRRPTASERRAAPG